MPEKNWSHGRLINGAKQIPAKVTDCSGWASDITDERWSRGQLINGAEQVPTKQTDCSSWGRGSQVWIAVEIRYAAATPKETVAKYAHYILQKLQAMAPDLGLEYDDGRSREYPQERSVVVAVSPTRQVADLEGRLYALLPKVRTAEPAVPVVGVGIAFDDSPAA